MEYFTIYLVVMNLITLTLYGMDKRRAQKRQWRISENVLIGCALIGGSLGALLGVRVFHHKTKHKKFTMGIPLILVLQIGVWYYVPQLMGILSFGF